LRRYSLGGFIRRRSLRRRAAAAVRQIRLKAASLDHQVKTLSGGNQQKVVLARWLLHGCQIYLFDEPTRGVDVAAKREIYRLMERLVAEGAGIVMISSDLPEVLRLSDRILVMRDGRCVGEVAHEVATQESVMRLMVGGEEGVR
jgi:ribose transport system ATP-binding protein